MVRQMASQSWVALSKGELVFDFIGRLAFLGTQEARPQAPHRTLPTLTGSVVPGAAW